MSEDEADRAARRRFGSVLQLKEQGHDIRSARLVEDLTRDARHMARGLRKSPVFTLTVVLTLALGIGGNTAIFSVVDQLLLRPLPYPDGDRLVTIYESFPGATGQFGNGAQQRVPRELARLAARQSNAPVAGRVAHHDVHPDRRRRADSAERAARLVGVLSPSRRRASARPRPVRGRRSPECSRRRRPQLSALAAALRR